MKAEAAPRPAVSVALSLKDHGEVAHVASEIHSKLGQLADSMRISVRGSASALVSILEELKGRGVQVSASLSLKGDAPVKR